MSEHENPRERQTDRDSQARGARSRWQRPGGGSERAHVQGMTGGEAASGFAFPSPSFHVVSYRLTVRVLARNCARRAANFRLCGISRIAGYQGQGNCIHIGKCAPALSEDDLMAVSVPAGLACWPRPAHRSNGLSTTHPC